jgi:hypothetical protein
VVADTSILLAGSLSLNSCEKSGWRIYLLFIHTGSHDRRTFLTLVAGGIPCFPVTLLGSFVYNRIVMKAGRTGKPDNISGPYSSHLLL